MAEEPPQPYLEEPAYAVAPHLLGGPDGFRERLADAGVTIRADNPGFYSGNANGGCIPYPDVAMPTTRGSWCLYWNFDQLLAVDPADATQGWGPLAVPASPIPTRARSSAR